jgi:hypothetical protein
LARHRPALVVEVHGASVGAADRDSILVRLRAYGYRSIMSVGGQRVDSLPNRTCHILCTA